MPGVLLDATRSDPVRGRFGAILLDAHPVRPAAVPADPDPLPSELAEPLGQLLEQHVGRSVDAYAALDERDAAAVALALRLAADLDALEHGSSSVAAIARQLTQILEQLELTPAARRRLDVEKFTSAGTPAEEVNPLARIRRDADRRLHAVE